MSISICPGMTLVDSLQAMGQAPPKGEPAPKPKRARTSDGKLRGDDPATPDTNEAWEPES